MTDFKRLTAEQLQTLKAEVQRRYEDFQSRKLNLDMTRGKPCAEQLDLSMPMLDIVNHSRYRSEDGTDCRNYGGLDGISEAKRFFAAYLEVSPDEIIVAGNASLNLMHDCIVRAMVKGVGPDQTPWGKLDKIIFLCPSPGYDRHFAICEYLDIDMIPIEMKPDGPDMDQVEDLVAGDEFIKGIWCVPKYSNPTGAVYSDEVVERLAGMQTKAPDFRIFWDNAYAWHHLGNGAAPLANLLKACKKAGHPERVLIFGSTNKVTFAGAGVAMMAGSEKNMAVVKKQMFYQTIGPDKINQLRHVHFFKDLGGLESHMAKHAAILSPKFDAVQSVLKEELAGNQIAAWSKPQGGYFVSVDTMTGCARRVIELAAQAGVKLTPAGSTYPYGHDPLDRNIRIAPSFPPLTDIKTAMELVANSIKLATIEKLEQRP
jgi:DNA-binding transcriptional MocR family regulator